MKMKYILLFVTLLILLMGAASATEVSEDVGDTNSITDEAVIQDTHKVSDTAMQENKVDNNIQTGKASDNEFKNSNLFNST